MSRWQWCEECQKAAQEAQMKSTLERADAPGWVLNFGRLEDAEMQARQEVERLLKYRVPSVDAQRRFLDASGRLSAAEENIGGRAVYQYWHNCQNEKDAIREANALLDLHHAAGSACPSWDDARLALRHWKNWREMVADEPYWQGVADRVSVVSQRAIRRAPFRSRS